MPQAGEQLTPQGQAQAVAVDAQYQQQLAARQYVASGGWDDPSGPVLDFSWAHDSGGLGNGQSDPWGGFDQYLYARPVIDSRTTQPAPAQILTIADTDPMGDPTGYTIDVAPNTKSDIIGDAWTHPNAMVDGGVKFLGSIGPGLVNSYLNGVQAEANLDIVNAAAISGQPIPELPNQSPVQLQMPTYDHKGEAGGALLTGLGLSVWGALEGITATVPEDIPPAIPLNNALPPNFKVLGLDDIPSSALDVGSLRESLGPFVTSGDTSRISVAAATVTNENGEVTNLLSVSGSSWKGNSPTNVTINGTSYTVIDADSGSLGSALSENGYPNTNHAEMKLGSYISDNFSDINATVDIAVQNTSRAAPGMCAGCVQTMPNLAVKNPNLQINLYQGSTLSNP
jgi:hypothetical protein